MSADIAADEAISPPKSRNDPCPCGSGKRYKQCHGGVVPAVPAAAAEDMPQWALLADAGLAAQQADELDQAEHYYRASLALHPDNPDVLHMLGVVRMQLFAFDEARDLITRAGEMTGWAHSSFRHNRGFVLSAFLSARPAASYAKQQAECDRMRAATRLSRSRKAGAVDLIVLASTNDAIDESALIADLAAQTLRPATIVLSGFLYEAVERMRRALPASRIVLLPEPTERGNANLLVALHAALSQCDGDYVQIVTDDCRLHPERLQRMRALLADSGARWGFGRMELSSGVAASAKAKGLIRSLDALLRIDSSTPVSALCAERHGFPIGVANLFFDRQLLIDCLTDSLVTDIGTATGLSLAALWRDEPAVTTELLLEISPNAAAAIEGRLADREHADIRRRFTARFLRETPANPLAPSFTAAGGQAILKRALRLGLGEHLNESDFSLLEDSVRRRLDEPELDKTGIEYIGFARAESGLGENLRAMVAATLTTAIPFAVSDVPLDSGIRNRDDSMLPYMTDRRFATRVICVNPDVLGEAYYHDGYGRCADAYRIGFWFWELERLPRVWVRQLRLVDEVWAATDFVADAVRRDASCPVVKVRTPVQRPALARAYSRAEFGLDPHTCLFLFSFAYSSFATRKNPEAAIAAFRRAFPRGDEHASLVIKTSQSETFPELQARLHQLASADRRIQFLDKYLSRQDVYGLQSVADCYVSLHRSEGLGLGLAECMAQGKPVIATAYSGNLEFMNGDNSYLVDYRLVPVREGDYPDFRGQVWADADVEHAALLMRSVFDDPGAARLKGTNAQQWIASEFSFQRTGELIAGRFEVLQHARAK